MNTKTEKNQEMSGTDIIRLLLDFMSDSEVEMILENFTYSDIKRLFNETAKCDKVIDLIKEYIVKYEVLCTALQHIPALKDTYYEYGEK